MPTTGKPQISPEKVLSSDKAAWQKAYRATTEALEEIRIRELAAMTDEEALRRIHALSTFETPWRERTDWSGLVEQQALFHRRRNR